MKNILKLSLLALLTIFTINISHAWLATLYELENYSYEWSLKDESTWNKVTIQWYINPETLWFWNWLTWINLAYKNVFSEFNWLYNILDNYSFWAFYTEEDLLDINEYNYNNSEITYSPKFPSVYSNKWLILYASKDLIESLNYNDPTYSKNNEYRENRYSNWKVILSYANRMEWWVSIKKLIVDSAGKQSSDKKWNIIIEWEFKEIDIDEDIYTCDNYFGWLYSSEKTSCLYLTNELKKSFYKWKIDAESFESTFKYIWESNEIENIQIKTKVFVMDKITIDWITYWEKAPIYNLSLKYKNSLDKTIDKINSLNDQKRDKIKAKIDSLVDKYRYWRKNYVILSYLKEWIDNYYSESKKQEAKVILDKIRWNWEWWEEVKDIFNNLLWDELF